VNERTTMNGKPVRWAPAKTVINFKSGFQKKLLCDGPTFSLGTACAYSCAFCFVPAAMLKTTGLTEDQHMQTVIRRENALTVLERQLLDAKGRPKFLNGPKLTIYASPLVDVAANMDLVRETIDACKLILSLTSWHIRLLSKSNLLPKVAEGLEGHCGTEEARKRIIYGFSTGTLDDNLAKAFEGGTPRVSKRIEALHQLQDAGHRTFGMICPSLPFQNYGFNVWAEEVAHQIRAEKCEHVWAEVINVRGESMERTVKALRDGGFEDDAMEVEKVSTDRNVWERYARRTFEAHRGHYKPNQLRFLQYATNDTRAFWESQQEDGAVIL
jgi:DNA repair photolyase